MLEISIVIIIIVIIIMIILLLFFKCKKIITLIFITFDTSKKDYYIQNLDN